MQLICTACVSSSARLETAPLNLAVPVPAVVSLALPVIGPLKVIKMLAGTVIVVAAFTDNCFPVANEMSPADSIAAAAEITVLPL